jgi:hypothetical protein
MHKLLKLQHHKHTGKKLTYHHTSYRGITAVLLFAFVSMFSINRANAATYQVNAKVSAPIPTQAAVITTPTTNTTSSESTAVVSGTCEAMTPNIFVIIERNNTAIGSAPCEGGSFNLNVTLLSGLNSLVPRSVNITDDYGPNGSAVNITYNPPSNSSPTPSSPTTNTEDEPDDAQGIGLFIESAQKSIVFTPKKRFSLNVTISGGVAPYELSVQWGDDDEDTLLLKDSTEQTLFHEYPNTSNRVVRLQATDKAGQVAVLELAAISLQPAPALSLDALANGSGAAALIDTKSKAMLALSAVAVLVTGVWIGSIFAGFIPHPQFASFFHWKIGRRY